MNDLLNKLPAFRFRLIPTALGICFALLLALIWISGYLGQSKLEEISGTADRNTTVYLKRLKLAVEIRAAAAETVSRVRLYRGSKDIGIRGPVFKINLNKAKNRLGSLLTEGKNIWNTNAATLPPAEVEAWKNLESISEEFWNQIKTEEKPDNRDQDKNIDTQNQTENAAAAPTDNIVSNENSNKNPDEDFFDRRTKLEDAADKLTNVITSGIQQTRNDMEKLQTRAAFQFGSANWITFIMGFLVILITVLLMRSYILQKNKEERLKQEAQGQLRSVFDSLTNDIVVIGKQGEVIDVNQSFLKHNQLSDAELKLQDYQAAFSQVPEIATFVGKSMENQESDQRTRDRIEVRAHNGHVDSRLFDVSVTPLKVGDVTEGRVVVMDNVTEEERVREELRRSRTLSAVGQITAQVAHEIYNPLGAVKLNLDLLEMQIGEDSDVRHTIGRLKRGVDHLSTIIMDLRYLTRPREPERKMTDLNKLLDDVVELASDRIERQRAIIDRDFSKEKMEGDFDQQQLRKVFLNLLINAVEASPKNGEVELRTRVLMEEEINAMNDFEAPNGALAVSVIDRGVGMSAETKKRLFEAFYTTKRNGTGLGMMITQEIVKKHNGKISVESEEGKGTTVSVYLPK